MIIHHDKLRTKNQLQLKNCLFAVENSEASEW